MSEPFIGEIRLVGFNFAPQGHAACDGQILSINQNQALFSLLGTTYGGDGRVTFGLPDLRSRCPIHASGGGAPGLSSRPLGSGGGTESVALTQAQMPSHSHSATTTINASGNAGTAATPAGSVLAASREDDSIYAAAANTAAMNAGAATTTLQTTGSSQSHDNMPPYRAINFVIALTGLFPSRN